MAREEVVGEGSRAQVVPGLDWWPWQEIARVHRTGVIGGSAHCRLDWWPWQDIARVHRSGSPLDMV